MRKKLKKATVISLGAIAAAGMITVSSLDALAANATATVSGTVASGTTADILYLYNSSDGTYTIKLDGETNFNDCKILTVGKKITVGIYRGADAYNHAATITAEKKNAGTAVDSSNASTVTGKVKDKTTEEILYLDTSAGEMVIKLDSSTNLSGCRVLVSGATVTAQVARGSDAYMHALSISSGNVSGSSSSSNEGTVSGGNSSSTAGTAVANTVAVSGTPEEKSTSRELYLKTKEGTYYLKVDDSCDTSAGFVFTTANKLTAYIYRGSDACMHAAKVEGTRNGSTVPSGNTTTFSGTVSGDSTEKILQVNTSGGKMQFKLDGNTSLQGTKALVKGQQITVNGTVGTDRYWHAVSIAAKESNASNAASSPSSATTSVPSNTTPVTGTISDKSKGNEVYLNTKEGTYYIKVDEVTDTTGGFMFTPGNKMTAYIYRGNDACMHAAKMVGTRNSGAVSGNTTAFSGTVESNSTEDMLLLKNSDGVMKFKLDSTSSLQGAKGLVKGRKVTVNGAVGSDRYWHAVTITAQ